METKHTPGPWKAVNAGKHWNNKAITNWQIQYSEDGECISDHVYEAADAKLIAAAPELLDALVKVEKWASEFGLQDSIYNTIVNAIKKATE